MKRSFTARAVVGALALAIGIAAAPSEAQAQEIQLTGPLAGAPAVRKQRLYREGRFEIAAGFGLTLLDEYRRSRFVSGRLQYNIFDWLGVGVFGGFDVLGGGTDLADRIDDTPAPRNSRTAVNLPGLVNGRPAQEFGEQVGKMTWMAAPQITFSPFRGKLALFQKIFVDTDLYIHGGVAFVGVKERGECGGTGQTACIAAASFAQQDRVAIAPSFGLGLTLYPSNFISLNVEYRAFPFSYNRGGFDSRGAGPDASFPDLKIDSEDQTFKFNQMVFIGVGFHLPTKPTVSE